MGKILMQLWGDCLRRTLGANPTLESWQRVLNLLLTSEQQRVAVPLKPKPQVGGSVPPATPLPSYNY